MGAQNDARGHGTAPGPYLGNSSLLLFFLLASGWSLLSQAQETDQGEGEMESCLALPSLPGWTPAMPTCIFIEDSVWGKRMKDRGATPRAHVIIQVCLHMDCLL